MSVARTGTRLLSQLHAISRVNGLLLSEPRRRRRRRLLGSGETDQKQHGQRADHVRRGTGHSSFHAPRLREETALLHHSRSLSLIDHDSIKGF